MQRPNDTVILFKEVANPQGVLKKEQDLNVHICIVFY